MALVIGVACAAITGTVGYFYYKETIPDAPKLEQTTSLVSTVKFKTVQDKFPYDETKFSDFMSKFVKVSAIPKAPELNNCEQKIVLLPKVKIFSVDFKDPNTVLEKLSKVKVPPRKSISTESTFQLYVDAKQSLKTVGKIPRLSVSIDDCDFLSELKAKSRQLAQKCT
jgi:hypothetical protein